MGLNGVPYHGIATFLGWKYDQNFSDKQLVVIGVPFDEGCAYRTGARFGPRAIRDASMRLLFASEDGRSFFDVVRREHYKLADSAIDAGDVQIYPMDSELTYKEIELVVRKIVEAGALPILLGGDCSITYPAVLGINSSNITVVKFDAHLDFHDTNYTVKNSDATPMRRISEMKLAKKIIHIGTRGYDNSPSDLEDTESSGNWILTIEDCYSGKALDALQSIQPNTLIYLGVDIDVFDPSFAPGTGYLEPGGLDYRTFKKLITTLGERASLVGCEVTEVAPMYDPNGSTSILAVHVLIDILTRIKKL
jgi:agmatinase